MAETALPTRYEIYPSDRTRAAGTLSGSRAVLPSAPPRGESVRREASGLGGLLGRAPAMQELFRRLAKASQSQSPVLIEGESGVGKRLTACMWCKSWV